LLYKIQIKLKIGAYDQKRREPRNRVANASLVIKIIDKLMKANEASLKRLRGNIWGRRRI